MVQTRTIVHMCSLRIKRGTSGSVSMLMARFPGWITRPAAQLAKHMLYASQCVSLSNRFGCEVVFSGVCSTYMFRASGFELRGRTRSRHVDAEFRTSLFLRPRWRRRFSPTRVSVMPEGQPLLRQCIHGTHRTCLDSSLASDALRLVLVSVWCRNQFN